MLKWISIFQKNIFSVINQGGNISKTVNIHRYCRQGHPIDSYSFIICVNLLVVKIRDNKGIHIGTEEFKLS